MPITFSCECGHELTVDEAHTDRKVFCPKCSKSRDVPEELRVDSGQDREASGQKNVSAASSDEAPALFSDAIAAFEDVLEADLAPDPKTSKPEKHKGLELEVELTLDDYDRGVAEEPAPAETEKPAEKPAEEKDEAREEKKADDPVEPDKPAKAPSAEPAAEPVAAVPIDSRKPDVVPKVIDDGREADIVPVAVEEESEKAGASKKKSKPLPISRYEVLGDKVKFTCECGKRIVSPIDAKRETGKCPKCGRKLLIPQLGDSPKRSDAEKKTASAGKSAAPVMVGGDTFACPHCGKTPPGGSIAKFCAFCGKDLASDPASGAPADEPKATSARAAADEAALQIRKARREKKRKSSKPEKPEEPAPAGALGASVAASLGARLGATLVDATLSLATFVFVAFIVKLASGDKAFHYGVPGIVAGMIVLFNEVFLVMGLGQTLGKLLIDIRVVGADRQSLSPGRVLLRGLFKLIAFAGAIMMFFDPEHRALHDILSGTLVVRGRSPSRG